MRGSLPLEVIFAKTLATVRRVQHTIPCQAPFVTSGANALSSGKPTMSGDLMSENLCPRVKLRSRLFYTCDRSACSCDNMSDMSERVPTTPRSRDVEFNYRNLWKTLIDRGIKRHEFMTMSGLSPSTVAKLSADRNVTVETIARICITLGCTPNDVFSVTETMITSETESRDRD